ncbi:MAG: biopolymer transporter ExbD [Isosphaeraceae bacterium]
MALATARKKTKKTEEVDIPITPMLDMAFQLLTFFILTYHPAPSEVQFSMSIMPAAPATDILKQESTAPAEGNDSVPAALKTLPTVLRAADGGKLGQVLIGETEANGMDALKRELDTILKDPSLPFDQALLKVDPNLRYSELMQVIDVFSSLKINKISFAELGVNDAP